jgi:cytochrome P450
MVADDPGPTSSTTTSTVTAPPLYPPAVTPPDAPLPILTFLREFPKNPLRSVPRAAYERDIFVLRPKALRLTYAWITGPELVEEILIRRAGALEKSQVEKRVFDKSVGESVLTADGARWRWQRRVLAPLFRHQEIVAYVPRMSEAAEEQIAAWRASGAGQHNIDEDMTVATLAVIMRTMLGNSDAGVGNRIMAATEGYLSKASWEAAYAILRFPNWMPHPGTWRMIRSARTSRGIMAGLIAERRAVGGADDDLLGRLLAARDPETDEPMDEEGLVNNLSTLLLAGHETTAKALSWTLYLLARSPQWQEAVREEVSQVAGTERISAQHIDQLTTTARVLKESMRLYPPAPVVARVNTEFIRAGDEDLPVGSNLVFPVYAIHRHHKYWEDPARFDPDRFLPAREAAIPRTQYMPFGAGPRICIGQAFAMIEATTLLASFVRAARFEWDGKHEPEPVSRVTLRPTGGMPLKVTPL